MCLSISSLSPRTPQFCKDPLMQRPSINSVKCPREQVPKACNILESGIATYVVLGYMRLSRLRLCGLVGETAESGKAATKNSAGLLKIQ